MKVYDIPTSKNYKYFWIVFFIYFIFQFISVLIANYLNPEFKSPGFQFLNITEEFVLAVIVAPILETLIFQYLIIETLLNLKVNKVMCIAISGVLFGISHWYSIPYVIVLTIVGFIFAYYYLGLRNQNGFNKLIFVALIHSLSNFIVFAEKNYSSVFTNVKNIIG